MAGGINKPNGIGLTPDQRQLIVSEYGGTNAWTFLIADDGSILPTAGLAPFRAPGMEAEQSGSETAP